MLTIDSVEKLNKHYSEPLERALWKEIDHINDHYKQFIQASPFLIMSTFGNKGIDCSPRGDAPGFVRVENSTLLMLPDRRGNNRLDSLHNIIENPNIGLIFLVPGVGETLRVSGKAKIIIDPALCESFSVNHKPASSVIEITVDKAYYQCQKAIARSKLWDKSDQLTPREVPTAGEMLQSFSEKRGKQFDGQSYDTGYADYMKKTLY